MAIRGCIGSAELVAIALLAGLTSADAQTARISAPIDNSRITELRGATHLLARPELDRGAVPSSFALKYVTLVFKPSPRQQQELHKLLSDQQDRFSSNYRHWLTPEQYADRFGLASEDMRKIKAWLEANGFQVLREARGRNWIVFSGSAEQIQRTFHAEIHSYAVGGEIHFANASNPFVPTALGDIVSAIRGLDDFRPKAAHRKWVAGFSGIARPQYTNSSGQHFLAPDDIATIYDLNPLYAAGLNGTGQSIAVIGQSDVTLADIAAFRSIFNLPSNVPELMLEGPDPGFPPDDVDETELDLEWAGAIARNATLIYVYSTNAFDAAQYAIDSNVAPVITLSYSLCEAEISQSDAMSGEQLLQEANAIGITMVVASGDAGPASCDFGTESPATQGYAVSFPASIPEVTAVGGTEFDEAGGSYWSTSNGPNQGSALSYIPEMVWNDSSIYRFPAASGGGTSIYFPTPAWQTGPGFPNDGGRDVPDVSLAASPIHDGYITCTPEANCPPQTWSILGPDVGFSVLGGTSVATPVFAGILVLANQSVQSTTGVAGLGNINPALYSLAKSSPAAFHGITVGNNFVPCVIGSTDCVTGSIGFNAGPGYDKATGLGSVDAYNLFTAASVFQRTTYTITGSITTSSGVPVPGVTVVLTPESSTTTDASGRYWFTGLAAGATYTVSPSAIVYTFSPPTQVIADLNSNENVNFTATPIVEFAFVPGTLAQVSVGADGAVWGINSSHQIYTYNSATQTWTNIPGSLTQIAVGSGDAVWGLNGSGQIYRWDGVHSQWLNIPGLLVQIAVGADGDVWGLNYQSSIYHYNAQTGFWTQVPGQLAHIAVGSAGAVYGINASGGAFWYNPGTSFFEYLGGPAFTQIGVGPDGYVVGLSNGVAYAYVGGAWYPARAGVSIAQVAMGTGASIYGLDAAGNIYFYNGQTQSWDQIPGALSSIAVGGDGAVWGLNSSQQIFQLQNAPMRGYQRLTSISGSLNQISVGTDGSVWGVSANTVEYFNPTIQSFQALPDAPSLAQVSVGASGDIWALDASGNVFQWDASSARFNNVPGQLTFIQVAANGSVWGLNAAGQIFTYSSSGWTNIPGALASLSVGADGTVWGLNAKQQIYRFDHGSQSWVNVPGAFVQISVGNANNIWGINARGEVYYYNNSSQSWVIIPGAYLTDISVAFDGSVWGVTAAGNLYQWNAGTQTFNLVGSGVRNVVVGNAAAVWSLNTNSSAVFSWF